MPAPQQTPQLAHAKRTAHSTPNGDQRFTHLSVVDLTHTYPDRRVLSEVSFTAAAGDRIGLIGENGTGKSTLLRLLAGIEAPESGSISLPGTVGLLQQELPYSDNTPMSQVLDDAQRSNLEAVAHIEQLAHALAEHPNDATVSHQYAVALADADRLGAWEAQSQRGEMLSGLGLDGIAQTREIGELSGGQRIRLSLAALLLSAPQTLLLDEPSNHLDDESAAYLERVLTSWPGIVVVASHDRALLDAVTTRMVDLDPLPVAARELTDSEDAITSEVNDAGSGFGIRVWGVGFSEARRERKAEMRRWRERYASESDELRALEHEIAVGSREVNQKHESKSESRITKKFYADKDARVTARRARNASVRLEQLERRRVRKPPEPLRFRGFKQDSASAEPGPGVVDCADRTGQSPSTVAESATEPTLSAHRVAISGRLGEVSVDLEPHGRLLLTGPNGSGKSTLLAILAGTLTPEQGTVVRSTRVGYLPQEVTFENPARSAAETYRQRVGEAVADRVPLTSLGLLARRDVDRAVGSLSVGQRRRLALAMLVADPPPVLLLDEPTNHLSLTLVEELEDALQTYSGALIVASHDRWLRARWGDAPALAVTAPSYSSSSESSRSYSSSESSSSESSSSSTSTPSSSSSKSE
ncbi:ABC-F family ATP-binding cassette domain-containing protein [Leucobacter denitrificans]|uniref:ABC-F family ATP-binding cassette domain-containing protein n=1 Tax=Leucobacter denitrificans TaxID=683042 RepID=A0A7G9S3Y9_9MICO|nr:ABC-F family ATP-binding cassette domain-containing protein [Leucobacter denitrificans]QNN62564.1 ABC-F family ATP-binding cassette domain-containing protein [Leucobacter denitrificans]